MTSPDPCDPHPYQQQPHQQGYGQQPYSQPGYPPQQQQVPYGQPYPQQPQAPRPSRSVRKERGLSAGSHTFHLIATICTCGAWGLFVWLPMWIYRMMIRRKTVTKHYYE